MPETAVYFDYAASNPLWPEAAAAMKAAATLVGNPSATHSFGRQAHRLLDDSRAKAAAFLDAQPEEITFTSGATEANNLAIVGLLAPLLGQADGRRSRIIISSLEHSSVRKPLIRLAERFGLMLDELPLSPDARVSVESVRRLITDETVMVCLTAANNILGSIQPLTEVGPLVAEVRQRRRAAKNNRPLYLISDAVQAAAWLPLRPKTIGLDALIVSGHKVGGPKGVGLLWSRSGLRLEPMLEGGGQEGGIRSGTENLASIVGLAAALETAADRRQAESGRCRALRQRLVSGLSEETSGWRVLGPLEADALPGTVFFQLPGTEGDVLALKLDAAGYAVSAGSACDAGGRRPPAVVAAAHGQQAGRWGGIRISFGRFTTEGEIEGLLAAMRSLAKRER